MCNIDELISVIMPVHNARNFLSSSIESILRQTYTNFELILVDDGSTDGSHLIIEKYVKCDRRVRAIHSKNCGPNSARNLGLEISKGKYIAFMDADDISFPSRLRVQRDWIVNTKSDICGANVVIFGLTIPRIWRYPDTQDGVNTLLYFNSAMANPTFFARREVFSAVALELSRMSAEDYLFQVSCVAAGLKITNVPQILLAYRIHAMQISSAKRTEQLMNRNIVVREHWSNSGFEFPFNNIYSFKNKNEINALKQIAPRFCKTNSQKNIARSQIWKMAMRSKYYDGDITNDITIFGFNLIQRLTLFIVTRLNISIR